MGGQYGGILLDIWQKKLQKFVSNRVAQINAKNYIQWGHCHDVWSTLDEEDLDLRKRVRYLHHCKDVLWSGGTGEYLKSLRGRHNLKHKTKEMIVQLGDVVLIQSRERNRGKWNKGIVNKLINGKDGVVRAIRLRARKSYLEPAIPHLYPVEFSCDQQREEQEERGEASQMNPRAKFCPQRRAAITAADNIRHLASMEAVEY
ncbi:hypothetical protein ACROYT_G033011 [Oculina patagonica]